MVFAVSSLALLVIAEIALGYVRSKDEIIGKLSPGKYTFTHHEFVEHMTINRFGLRESGFSPTLQTRRVLLLGDSFVEGTGQSDQETIAWLLNRHFADKKYQFFNAGVSGADISDYADMYRKVTSMLSDTFSRVVIFIFLGNDFLDYEKLPAVKRKRDLKQPPKETRGIVHAMAALLPNTLESIRHVRRSFANVEVPSVPQAYSAETHVEWFNENTEYFDRPRLSVKEEKKLEERFNRIPPKSRELISQGSLNKWLYHVYVTEALNDFIYNMDSDYNKKIFDSTMRALDRLIAMISADVSIVLIPDKVQISEDERHIARLIMGANSRKDEFRNLFEVNARVMAWISERHPHVKVYDVTNDLRSRDARQYYYRLDGHMNPAGAELMAQGVIKNILE